MCVQSVKKMIQEEMVVVGKEAGLFSFEQVCMFVLSLNGLPAHQMAAEV